MIRARRRHYVKSRNSSNAARTLICNASGSIPSSSRNNALSQGEHLIDKHLALTRQSSRAGRYSNTKWECVLAEHARGERKDDGAWVSRSGELTRLNCEAWTLLARLRSHARREVNHVEVPATWRRVEHRSPQFVETATGPELRNDTTTRASRESHGALPAHDAR